MSDQEGRGSCQRHRVAIEARLDDLFLTVRKIAQSLVVGKALLGVDVLAIRICDVPVEPFVPTTDGLHGGRRHAGIMAA